ncbi:hypothetical protein CEUSTIGMA_g895.t1 [Chlamydomonas eustigma]|uniref:Cyclic nucleotide-binding domain-containing protein n=1 Tax=Chlamydomonas eustigma TaxID=1157962 RepID=A0A250WRK9_9CHLO|nr:hypothetical protein CEUSTIGMA_g895.t1 [Chlamydomonas eustigma]|eukprot:GAX73443.1 hypothetical protein CEUSTIGMA_g895.t1 [Chlamydomonas eustigma]
MDIHLSSCLQAALEKRPSDRSPSEIRKLLPLIQSIKSYQALDEPVQTFLATYATLEVIWETVELPKTTFDASNLFNVLCGGIWGISCEAGDPQLMVLGQMAARDIMSTEEEPPPEKPKFNNEEIVPVAPARKMKRSETIDTFQLDKKFNNKKVTSRLWRTIIGLIRAGLMPTRTASLAMLASEAYYAVPGISTEAPEPMGLTHGRVQAPGNGGMGLLGGVGGSIGPSGFGSNGLGGPVVDEFGPGDSFSGRDMDCQHDASLVMTHMPIMPHKVQGAVTQSNTMTALLVISQAVFRQAMTLQLELSVTKAVDVCCRLPFLRHTPLKEMFKLSKYLDMVKMKIGDVVLSQGRDNSSVFLLVEGEVELVVDVPSNADHNTLMALFSKLASATRTSNVFGRNAKDNGNETIFEEASLLGGEEDDGTASSGDGGGSVEAAAERKGGMGHLMPLTENEGGQPKRRVVLGRRGPGSILGDDLLREKGLVLTVVVSSKEVTVLTTSAQRFTASLDPMTQRLFQKLRLQAGLAPSELTHAIMEFSARLDLAEKVRDEVIMQTFDGSQKGVPKTLRRAPEPGKPRPPWLRTDPGGGNQFFSVPESLVAGERLAEAAATESWSLLDADDSKSKHRAHKDARSNRDTAAAASAVLRTGSKEVEEAAWMRPSIKPAHFKDAPPSASLNRFLQVLKDVDEKRSLEQALRTQRRSKISTELRIYNKDSSIVSKIDISAPTGGAVTTSHQKYTDMHEVACIAVINIARHDGQAPPSSSDPLAIALDDAVVEWSRSSHKCGLSLVRWESLRYYLIGPLNPTGHGKRPTVRNVADVLLDMQATFNKIWSYSEVPYFSFSAAAVIGAVFMTYDCGRFLTSICFVPPTGHAFEAASQLCLQIGEESPTGGILVSDAVSQALGRTHALRFTGPGYLLMGRVDLPFGATFEAIFGKKTEDSEPTSRGNAAASLMRSKIEQQQEQSALLACKSSHFGDSGTEFSLDDGFGAILPFGPGSRLSNTQTALIMAALQTASVRVSSSAQLKPETLFAQSLGGSSGTHDPGLSLSRNISPQHLRSAGKPNNQLLEPLLHRSYPEAGGRFLANNLGLPNESRHSPITQVSTRVDPTSSPKQNKDARSPTTLVKTVRVAKPNTLEPRMVLTNNYWKLEKLCLKSAVDIRQQLRQEVEELRQVNLSISPSPKPPHTLGSRSSSRGSAHPKVPGTHETGASQAHGVPKEHTIHSLSKSTPLPANLHMRMQDVVAPPLLPSITPYGPGLHEAAGLPARRRSANAAALAAAAHVSQQQQQGRPLSPNSGLQTFNGASTIVSSAAVASPHVQDMLTAVRPRSPGVTRRPRSGSPVPSHLPLPGSRPASPGGGLYDALRPTSPAAASSSGIMLLPPVREYWSGSGGPALPPDVADHVLASGSLRRAGSPREGTRPEGGNRPTSRHAHRMSSPPASSSHMSDNVVATNYGPVPFSAFSIFSGIQQVVSVGSQTGVSAVYSTARVGREATAPDPISGLSANAIHRQAVATWKDLGSLAAAEQYVKQVHQGVVNLSFSTSGLSKLPDTSRLPYVESFAASFNCLSGLKSTAALATLPKHLKVLTLSHCNITELPSDLGVILPSLVELNVSSNQLQALPASMLETCVHLTALSVERNLLAELPVAISRLDCLQQLYAAGNLIEEIHDNAFQGLKALQVLDLSSNQLHQLPASIASLPSLTILKASVNSLTALPEALLDQASCLTHLELADNRLCQCCQTTGFRANDMFRFNRDFLNHGEDEEEEEEAENEERNSKLMARMNSRRLSHSGSMSMMSPVGAFKPPTLTTQPSSTLTPARSMRHTPLSSGNPAAAGVVPLVPHSAAKSSGRVSIKLDGMPSLGQLPEAVEEEEEQLNPNEAAAEASSQPCAGRLPQLRTLDLSSNQLLCFPTWLPSGLTCLKMARNALDTIPEWAVSRLMKLKLLDLHGNKIDTVSKELTRLTDLSMAALQENPCTDIEAGGVRGGGAAWLEAHVKKLKYQARVRGMNEAAEAAAAAAAERTASIMHLPIQLSESSLPASELSLAENLNS